MNKNIFPSKSLFFLRDKKTKYFINNKGGFTILETMVAIAIFSIGLVGISSLFLQTMQAESLNAGYLKASMLAQEGVELVRNVRDENWLDQSATSWDRYIADGGADTTFVIDYNPASIYFNPDTLDSSETILSIDANNFYSHSGVTPTNFRRLITIDDTTCGNDCWSIKSEVRWTSSGRTNNYIAETILYDWR